MIAAHPAARVRHDLLLRAACLANSLHDPRLGHDRRAEVAALRTARAGAAHVARLAAPPVAPRLTLASADLVLHRGAGLWSELVDGLVAQRPTCAVCDAPVEHASVARSRTTATATSSRSGARLGGR